MMELRERVAEAMHREHKNLAALAVTVGGPAHRVMLDAPTCPDCQYDADVALAAVSAHITEGLDGARQAINDAWTDFDDDGDEDPVPYARVALDAALRAYGFAAPSPEQERDEHEATT